MPLNVVDAYVSTRDGREIVRGVSLEIREGRIHVLMGPNGAGKSSLAQAVMGHRNYVYKGKLLFDGEDITGLSTAERVKRGLTLAVQIPVEVEGVRVSEILVRVAQKFRGTKTMKEAMQVIREALEAVGLSESLLAREYMVGMSGGERKRLELARIIIQKPKIAILDEPDSGVDVESIPKIAAAIEKLAESGTGILLITHQPRLLTRLIPDKVYVMLSGRIVAEGGIELVRRIEEKGYTPFRGE
ncbi:Fe-S cluster assembly ATPase SufC [Hyperthermus butylicus]|uniref:Fe-S cluster assembly ATPase SufC n=1 Tax=Hyperthermus butylicus TaxID=54248 RepID=UPI00064E8269|nr:Fe-S cluster assembly ATPase SufC [Hyperthermus butylicus]